MYPYKIVYLEGTFLKKATNSLPKGQLDGLDMAKELEALLIEQNELGFELFSITPITGIAILKPSSTPTTTGFMVTFKQKAK